VGTSRDSTPLDVPARPSWLRLSGMAAHTPPDRPLRTRTVLAQVVVGALVVAIGVALAGAIASRRIAERESVTDAAQTTDLIAQQVIQPAMTDGLISGDPAAVAAMDHIVRTRVLSPSLVPGQAVDRRWAHRLLRRTAADRSDVPTWTGGASGLCQASRPR
jgi:two-component system NarL family sensor kinase